MRRSPARGPTPCGSPTIRRRTKKGHRRSTERYRRAGRTWFGTFCTKELHPSSSTPTAGSRSICSTSRLAPPPEHERPRLVLRGAEPEVVVALAERSRPRPQPRFASCCGTQRQRSRTDEATATREPSEAKASRGGRDSCTGSASASELRGAWECVGRVSQLVGDRCLNAHGKWRFANGSS